MARPYPERSVPLRWYGRTHSPGKTVPTEDGEIDPETSRDRKGTFEPAIVPNGERRLDGFDDRILPLNVRGMTVREIRGRCSACELNADRRGHLLILLRCGGPAKRVQQHSSTGAITYTGNGESYEDFVTPATAVDDTITVTINVMDVDEPPGRVGTPTLTATPNSRTSLDVSWSAPTNTRRPDISSYDLHFRLGTDGSWHTKEAPTTGISAMR